LQALLKNAILKHFLVAEKLPREMCELGPDSVEFGPLFGLYGVRMKDDCVGPRLVGKERSMLLKRLVKDEAGQGMVITIVAMGLLLAFVGLAVDVGVLFRAKRNIQIAADAAATAAALDYHYNQSVSSAQSAGRTAASSNGYANNTSCPGSSYTCVTINMPPQNGPNTAHTSYAEAIVRAPNTTTFMALVGFKSVDVAARAVAGNPEAGKSCVFITGQGPKTLQMKGSYQISATSNCAAGQPAACGISVDSTDSDAVDVTGNGGCINANFIDVAGGWGGNHPTKPTPVTTNVGNVAGDPFITQVSTIAQPTPGGSQTGCTNPVTTSGTITQAIATSLFSSLSAANSSVVCFENAVAFGGTVTLPGSTQGVLYIFENGVTLNTGSNVQFGSGNYDQSTNQFTNTAGATMEIENGSFTQGSSSNISVYAPTYGTQGTTNGIGIWQPASNTNPLQIQFGSSNATLDGFIYAPGADLTFHDSGGNVIATGLVAKTMNLGNGQLLLPNYNTANQDTTPLTVITLVE
jgi:Flp pilus assembly protein TadG